MKIDKIVSSFPGSVTPTREIAKTMTELYSFSSAIPCNLDYLCKTLLFEKVYECGISNEVITIFMNDTVFSKSFMPVQYIECW